MSAHSELAAALQLDLANSNAVWNSENSRQIGRLRQHIELGRMIAEVRGHDAWRVPSPRGDEIRQCFDSPVDAAECALSLIAHFNREAQAALGLPRMLPRVALHWGRVVPRGEVADGDAFLEVSAIEPEVGLGEAWATEHFAAALQSSGPDLGLRLDYIGMHSFGKLRGERRIYRIAPRDTSAESRGVSGRRDPVEIAIAVLKTGTDLEQENALLALGGLRSLRSTRALLATAADGSRSANHRHAALKSLAQLADPDASATLKHLLATTPGAPTRRLLVHAIGAIKDSDNAGDLIAIAESSNEPLEVREAALLNLFGTPPGRSTQQIADALTLLLGSPTIDLVRAAAVASSIVGVPAGALRERLATCVASKALPVDVRQAALESLTPGAVLEPPLTAIAVDVSEPDPLRRLVLDYLFRTNGNDALRLLHEVAENSVDPLRTYALLGLSQMHSVVVRPLPPLSTSESAHAQILRLRLPA